MVKLNWIRYCYCIAIHPLVYLIFLKNLLIYFFNISYTCIFYSITESLRATSADTGGWGLRVRSLGWCCLPTKIMWITCSRKQHPKDTGITKDDLKRPTNFSFSGVMAEMKIFWSVNISGFLNFALGSFTLWLEPL